MVFKLKWPQVTSTSHTAEYYCAKVQLNLGQEENAIVVFQLQGTSNDLKGQCDYGIDLKGEFYYGLNFR